MSIWIAVAGFAILGTWIRFATVQLVAGSLFPIGTLLVNVFGSLGVGLVVTLQERGNWPLSDLLTKALLIGGFGAMTTFSSYALETLKLLQSNHLLLAFANIMLSNVASLAAMALGILLARFIS